MDDNSWKEEKPVPTKDVTQWWSAYDVSMSVLKKPTQLASLVYPLNKLSEKEALDKLWKGINAVRLVQLHLGAFDILIYLYRHTRGFLGLRLTNYGDL